MLKQPAYCFILLSVVACGDARTADAGLYLGSGAKAGEITSTSARVYTRLTSVPGQDDQGHIPGAAGEIRLRYGPHAGLKHAVVTAWAPVDPDVDYAMQIPLEDLKPGLRYFYRFDYRAGPQAPHGSSETYSFQTAPPAQVRERICFQVTTGQDLRADGTYFHMAQQQPHFLVATGDNVYYDSNEMLARNVPQAYQAYQKMYGLPFMKRYYEHIGGYFMKDDHDYRFNDADPYQNVKAGDGGRRSKRSKKQDQTWLSHEEGIRVFKQVFPMSEKTYRTFRWGQGVQIWLLEGRDYRSANSMPDGPDKTIWGAAQKAWLKTTLQASDADWRVVISPTPIIGPDRPTKTDNHANRNGFWTEGQAFLDWIKTQGLSNVVLVCGDRHWQYHSVDRRNDRLIHEFSSGPTCDEHTQTVVTPAVSRDFAGVTQPYAASSGGVFTVVYQADRTLTCALYNARGVKQYQKVLRP